jgi:MoaA/NifB/PqqE/SkfB family radical SAM enzyme
MVFIGNPPFPAWIPEANEAHVSVTFTWDRAEGERLAKFWGMFLPTKLGGPAFNSLANEFTPGLYLKKGITITSRGCPRHCWFCRVPKMEGEIQTISINGGWIVQDNNFLATPKSHQMKVFKMLREQKRQVTFSGGLDIRLLNEWTINQLSALKIRELFFSFDDAKIAERMMKASKWLSWLDRRKKRCYVLIGIPGDNLKDAEDRLKFIYECGFLPYAMVYRGEDDSKLPASEWGRLARKWRRPIMIHNEMEG